jgi:hypothetical protein
MIKIVVRVPVVQSAFRSAVIVDINKVKFRDDLKLPGDSGEVPIAKWSGWRFDSRCPTLVMYSFKYSTR